MLKKEGNEYFKQGNYSKALEVYVDASAKVKEIEKTDTSPKALAVLHSNVAACFHKLGFYKKCIEECNEAIKLFPFWERPYKRRHEAFKAFKEYLFTSHGDSEETINADRRGANIIVDCEAAKKKQKKKNGQWVYKSLNEAFTASKSGDKIFIEKGLHSCPTHAILGKMLQVVGASSSECIIEGTQHNAIVYHGLDQQPAGLLKRVTLRLSPENRFVNILSVVCGYLDVVDCIIQDGNPNAYSCVGVSRRELDNGNSDKGSSINPLDLDTRLTVKYCILDGARGGDGGAMGRGGGNFVIDNSFISGYKLNGIWITDKNTQGKVSNCDIQYNKGCGISVHKKAEVVLFGNYIHSNGSEELSHGLELGPDIDASVFCNLVSSNINMGIHIDHSNVRIKSNIISNHSDPSFGVGIHIGRKGNVTVKSNIIFNNASGILSQDGSCPLITSNQLEKCNSGCFLKTQSSSEIVNNVFTACRYGAQYYFESSGILAKNTFKNTTLFGVMVAENSTPELSDNTYINCGYLVPPKENLEKRYSKLRNKTSGFMESWDIRNKEEEEKYRDVIRAQPRPQAKLRVCNYCLNHSNHSKLCSNCRSVYYCSKECQKEHWKHHKKFCVTEVGPKRDKHETDGLLPPSDQTVAQAWLNMLKL